MTDSSAANYLVLLPPGDGKSVYAFDPKSFSPDLGVQTCARILETTAGHGIHHVNL